MESTLGSRIGEVITDKKLSYEDVASTLEMSAQGVRDWVGGKSTPRELKRKAFAKAYKVNDDWLLTGLGEMYVPDNTPPPAAANAGNWKEEAYKNLEARAVNAEKALVAAYAMLEKLGLPMGKQQVSNLTASPLKVVKSSRLGTGLGTRLAASC